MNREIHPQDKLQQPAHELTSDWSLIRQGQLAEPDSVHSAQKKSPLPFDILNDLYTALLSDQGHLSSLENIGQLIATLSYILEYKDHLPSDVIANIQRELLEGCQDGESLLHLKIRSKSCSDDNTGAIFNLYRQLGIVDLLLEMTPERYHPIRIVVEKGEYQAALQLCNLGVMPHANVVFDYLQYSQEVSTEGGRFLQRAVELVPDIFSTSIAEKYEYFFDLMVDSVVARDLIPYIETVDILDSKEKLKLIASNILLYSTDMQLSAYILQRLVLYPEELQRQLYCELARDLYCKLHEVTTNERNSLLGNLLTNLDIYASGQSTILTSTLLNCDADEGRNIFSFLLYRSTPIELLSLALSLGADTTEISVNGGALAVAITARAYKQADIIWKKKRIELPDPSEFDLLLALLDQSDVRLDEKDVALKWKMCGRIADKYCHNGWVQLSHVQTALYAGELKIAKKLFRNLEKEELSYEDVETRRLYSQIYSYFKRLKDYSLGDRGGADLVRESLQLFQAHRDMSIANLYLETTADIWRIAEGDREHSPSWHALAMRVFDGYSQSSLFFLYNEFEQAMDHFAEAYSRRVGYHDFESELLLLLAHRDFDTIRDHDTINAMTRALTSIHGVIEEGIKSVNLDTVEAWRGIGLLGFSHRKLLVDARHYEDQSLLEKFGFEYIASRKTDRHKSGKDLFGPGYAWYPGKNSFRQPVSLRSRPFAGDVIDMRNTYLELRRGYLLVHHPDEGSLLIRNASPHFGRSNLRHSAYYSFRAMNVGDLLALTPERIEKQFYPLLSAEVNSLEMQKAAVVPKLVQRIFTILDSYHRYKFDTAKETAWDGDMLLGGPYSRGFLPMVEHMERAVLAANRLTSGAMLGLSFVHPEYPHWSNPRGDEANRASKLWLDKERMKRLRRFAETTDTDQLTADEHSFFQLGFDHQAELILIERKA